MSRLNVDDSSRNRPLAANPSCVVAAVGVSGRVGGIRAASSAALDAEPVDPELSEATLPGSVAQAEPEPAIEWPLTTVTPMEAPVRQPMRGAVLPMSRRESVVLAAVMLIMMLVGAASAAWVFREPLKRAVSRSQTGRVDDARPSTSSRR